MSKLFNKLKNNRGASAITLAIFAVILISIFIVMSMNQIGNQMKSTRNRNENIELKYVAEAGTEQIISDIYKQIEENTKVEISKFEKSNNASIVYNTSSYTQTRNVRQNSDNNYLISHLDDSAKMYLSISDKIRPIDSGLADDIVEKIYKPITKSGYDIDGKNLTLIGWAKEAQKGNKKAIDLLIEKIGFNDNTDITPEYNGNTEIIPNRPNTSGIKKDIENISKKINDNYKVEFKNAEYNLNLSLYTATHMKYEHNHHVVLDTELEESVVYYLDYVIKTGSMELAFKEAAKTNAILAQEISFLQQKIFFLINDVRIIKGGYITRNEVIKKINSIIDEIVDMQIKLINNNMNSSAILLEKTKRQLIEVKCRLGNVNLGGSEVTPVDPDKPIDPNPDKQDPDDPQEGSVIIVPVNIKKADYQDKIIINNGKVSYKLNKDINLDFKIVLKLIREKDDDNNINIYEIITKNPYPSKKASIDITSKYNIDYKQDYNMKATIRFRIKDVNKANKRTEYEILQWNK